MAMCTNIYYYSCGKYALPFGDRKQEKTGKKKMPGIPGRRSKRHGLGDFGTASPSGWRNGSDQAPGSQARQAPVLILLSTMPCSSYAKASQEAERLRDAEYFCSFCFPAPGPPWPPTWETADESSLAFAHLDLRGCDNAPPLARAHETSV